MVVGVMTRLRSYQAELKTAICEAWAAGHPVVLAVMPARTGKCLAKNTPVLMYDGTVEMVQDIQQGDFLMGPDSLPRRVLSVCRGTEEMWRVTPLKGDPYVVNASHILSLRQSRTRAVARCPGEDIGDRVVNMNVVDYSKLPRWKRQNLKGWRTGVDFPKSKQPSTLPPYFLGLWLGDGHSRKPAVTTMDPEVVQYMHDFAASVGLSVRSERAGGLSNTYHITSRKSTGRGVSLNVVETALRRYWLIRDKRIPQAYKVADRQQRLELMAGLMDSDGCWTGCGFEYTTKIRALADDIAFLARSLGFAAYVKSSMKSCNGGPKAEYFRMHIAGNLVDVPCKVARKKPTARKGPVSTLVSAISVEPIGVGEYFGFEIDGDHLFMLGDFTVTHNTVLFSDIIRENQGGSVAIAHRARLVEQMSFALAKAGVRHRVIGPAALQRACSARHLAKLRRNFVDPSAWCAVASVNTLAKRKHEPWMDNVTLWVTDEGHHLTKDSMWDDAIKLFTRARGLIVTATPVRADGKGLGRHADGVADVMVVGRSPRELITMGYLVDYRLVLAESDVKIDQVKVGASGDFVQAALATAVHESKRFVGDVVREYLRHGGGRPGITFAVDVESAKELVQAYRAAGVPAELVTADTPDVLRLAVMAEFEAGRLKQLVNVDLFGEGVDLPDVHVVSMARHTNSYGLFIQQFWRGGTLLISDELHRVWSDLTDEQRRAHIAASAKPKFTVIDHVGNVMRHARTRRLPCVAQNWSLDARERTGGGGQADDVIPLRVCANPDAKGTGLPCAQPYERTEPACPHCEFVPVPAVRSGPEHVDGNLIELDAETLAALRGEVQVRDAEPSYTNGQMLNHVHHKQWSERTYAQKHLRAAMALFCGYQMDHMGRAESEMYKRFYFAFGLDSLSAQALGARDAEALRGRIVEWLERHGVVT